jgi:hypothetical protein
MQMGVHRTFRDAKLGGDLRGLHPVLPPHQRDPLLPRRHVLDDLPRSFQGDRVQGLGRGIGRGRLVPGLDVGLPAAERLPAPEIADVLVHQRAKQPGPLPVTGLAAQPRPGPRGRLERVLDQVRGKLAVTAGTHARVAKQPPVMSREEPAQFGDVVPRDPGLAAIVHAAPPPSSASARACPGRSSMSPS